MPDTAHARPGGLNALLSSAKPKLVLLIGPAEVFWLRAGIHQPGKILGLGDIKRHSPAFTQPTGKTGKHQFGEIRRQNDRRIGFTEGLRIEKLGRRLDAAPSDSEYSGTLQRIRNGRFDEELSEES